MVSGYSRVITARMLPSRRTGDLTDGHWRLLAEWGAVPKTLVWDNEAGVGRGRPTSEFAAFAGLLATKIYLWRPRDPEAKGLVERANGYLETSFLPGRHFSGQQVIVLTSGGEIVAQHARCWARHQTLTDPEHAEAGQAMRQEARRRPTGQIHAVGSASSPLIEVEQRELGSYDRLFTVIDGGEGKEAG
ncbi:hypothetical protein [Streptomyces cahuitamycinicus]|uniref:hypothetical protein n=1 Tax=Streptomyces cahuitamycinicus TaxID=2070367 RepID=UPI003183FB55